MSDQQWLNVCAMFTTHFCGMKQVAILLGTHCECIAFEGKCITSELSNAAHCPCGQTGKHNGNVVKGSPLLCVLTDMA